MWSDDDDDEICCVQGVAAVQVLQVRRNRMQDWG